MIVPSNRLLFWFAVIAVPFSVLAGILPTALPACLAVIAALGIAAAWDALAARRIFAGVRLDAPVVSRLALGREARIELRLQDPGLASRRMRLALPLPATFAAPGDGLTIDLPAAAGGIPIPWACTPGRRGRFFLDAAHLETATPLGFWNARTSLPLSAEIRVYPNLREERRSLRLMFRGPAGAHAQRQVGKGREFEKLRDYAPGDGSEDIHWKATARRGRPITKVFQVERTQEVYVALDTSRLSAREDAIERHISTALLLGLAAEQQGDLFGLLSFSDQVERFARARNGAAHFQTCRDAIYALQPRAVNPDFGEVCGFIRLRLRRRALVIFLTALDDPALAEDFLRHVDIVARQHLVIVGMMNPAGVAPMFDAPDISCRDELYDRLGGHLRWQNLEEIGRLLHRRGIKLAVYEGRQMGMRLVADYLTVKKRQIL